MTGASPMAPTGMSWGRYSEGYSAKVHSAFESWRDATVVICKPSNLVMGHLSNGARFSTRVSRHQPTFLLITPPTACIKG